MMIWIEVMSALFSVALVILVIWLREQFLWGRAMSKEILTLEKEREKILALIAATQDQGERDQLQAKAGRLNTQLKLLLKEMEQLNRSVRLKVKWIGADVFLLLSSWLVLLVLNIGGGGSWSLIIWIAVIAAFLLELGGFGIWVLQKGIKRSEQPSAETKTTTPKEPEKQKEAYSAASTPKRQGGTLRLLFKTAILVAILIVLVGVISKNYPPKEWLQGAPSGAIVAVLLGIYMLRWRWFRWVAVVLVITAGTWIYILGWQNVKKELSAASSNPYPAYNPNPLAISPDVWEKGVNDHLNDDVRFFDVVLAGDGEFGKEGYVRPPREWTSWRKYWVSREPDRHIGFLFSGASPRSIGPFGPNLPPPDDERFSYRPREWTVQGVGTIRYECLTGCGQGHQ